MSFHHLIHRGVLATLVATVSASTVLATGTLYQHREYGGAHWVLHHNDRMIMARGESIGTTTNGHCPSCDSRTLNRPDWKDHVSSFRVSAAAR